MVVDVVKFGVVNRSFAMSFAVLAFLTHNAGRDVLLVEPGQPEAEAGGGELRAYVR